jgi:hypothetical protein
MKAARNCAGAVHGVTATSAAIGPASRKGAAPTTRNAPGVSPGQAKPASSHESQAPHAPSPSASIRPIFHS